MERHDLIQRVQELRANLAQAESVDPEALALLHRLTDDIHRMLDEEDPTSADDVKPDSNVLNDLVMKFEADHPDLAMAIGKVADALAAIGI